MIKQYVVTIDGTPWASFEDEQDAKAYVDMVDGKVHRGPVCYDEVLFVPARHEYTGDDGLGACMRTIGSILEA